jgi:hypothetical protein
MSNNYALCSDSPVLYILPHLYSLSLSLSFSYVLGHCVTEVVLNSKDIEISKPDNVPTFIDFLVPVKYGDKYLLVM